MSNLVDSMMEEMEMNNSPSDINYQPNLAQSPIQPQQQMRMGEVNYMPHDQMQAPTMQSGVGMQAMGQPMGPESPDMADMEAPDLSVYGMEEESGNWTDTMFMEAKAPLIVIALAFAMSLPQISTLVRNGLAQVTTNMLYINILQSVIIGVLFYVTMKLLA